MYLISHRGNINGPNIKMENPPSYVTNAISKGFDVEVDVWVIDNKIYLGHDSPQHLIDLQFLQNKKFWCHCKNISALKYLLNANVHCFFHQTDDVTLTSDGFIWTFPGKEITKKSICVMPERSYHNTINLAAGICSDYIDNLEFIKNVY